MGECNCNEGGICHPCYDAKCEEVKRLRKRVVRAESDLDLTWCAISKEGKILTNSIKKAFDEHIRLRDS